MGSPCALIAVELLILYAVGGWVAVACGLVVIGVMAAVDRPGRPSAGMGIAVGIAAAALLAVVFA